MNFRHIFLAILLFFSTARLYSQIDDITFRQVSPPGGFSFQSVHIIKQDLFGYIWMGTFDGVIRYDSKKTVHFTHNPENITGLPSDRTSSIVIDNQNNVWVSTDQGICMFNRQKQQFERVNYFYEDGKEANKKIYSMELDGNGKLWIADAKFFGYLDRDKNQLIRVTEGLTGSPRLLYNDQNNRMWVGTNNGTVFLVSPLEKRVVKKIKGPGSFAKTIFTNNNRIWVGYEDHGVRLYDLDGKLITHYTSESESDFKNTSIRKILRDTRGRIWIASYLGLYVSFGNQLIRFDPDVCEGLPHNSIHTIFEDKHGGIWIGTWSGGVAYLHHSDNKFVNFQHSKAPETLSSNMVSSFVQTQNGDFFVGTETDGLNKFDVKTRKFQKIKLSESERILNIKALCNDKQDGLWVGTAFNGLYYRPKGTEKFIHFVRGKDNGTHISSKGIYTLCASDSGIWIGTGFGGINFYSFKTKQIHNKSKTYPFSKLKNENIRTMTLDSNNNLWVGSLNGLYRIYLPSGKLTQFNYNSSKNQKTLGSAYYFVTELSDGKIWIGTKAGGINIYNPKTDEINYFDAHGLLKEKDVYGIIESTENNIWITSNDGLILHNTRKNSSRKFDISDRIQGNLFNPNAIFKDSNANLYFGGTNGFSMLASNHIKLNRRRPDVFINQIDVNNKKIIPNQTGINTFEKIILQPGETTLSFHFSSDNYLLPEKNRFKFRLLNYSDQWVEEDYRGNATFINLPPGKHIFEVKAGNNDGVWNENPARIAIEIRNYWYKSDLAIVFYILLILSVVAIFVRFHLERLKLKKKLAIEKIKREHEEELHEMKLKFFTNISHEFRTPLTLINWPVNTLLEAKNLNEEQHKQLNTIKRNTNRLLLLINQIMDLRKVEKGQIKLNISKFDLIEFINERVLNFSEEAKSKNIELSFKHDKESFIMDADEEKLDKIIFNLLSNAFKFTPENGKISVVLYNHFSSDNNHFSNKLSFGKLEDENFAEIQVIDNGGGIDSEDLPNIFERFEQGKQRKPINNSTGIGLHLCKEYTLLHRGVIIVQSTPGAGSLFSVQLPARQKAQKILYESHEEVKNLNSWNTLEKTNLLTQKHTEEVKILIVEDNVELREFMVKFLEQFYTVVFAENGKQGLEILKKQNINLTISDVMMPEMDGFEFCQNIKSQIETSHIPVILLTALSSSENTVTGLGKGADAYITKPFDENILIAQITNLLQLRKKLQESFIQKFVSKQPIEVGNLDNYFLNKINSSIRNNIENEDFSVEKMADEIGISRSQLHRKIKILTGVTTSEYIMIVKIKAATSLLATKNFTIDEVAFKTGFNSHSYFTKCFKKYHKKSPKEYLKTL